MIKYPSGPDPQRREDPENTDTDLSRVSFAAEAYYSNSVKAAVIKMTAGFVGPESVKKFLDEFVEKHEEFRREDVLAVMGNLTQRGSLEQFNCLRKALGLKAKIYTPKNGGVADTLAYLSNKKMAFEELDSFRNINHKGSLGVVRDETAVDDKTFVLLDESLMQRLESDQSFRQTMVASNARFILPGASLEVSPLSGATPESVQNELVKVLEYAFAFDIELSSSTIVNQVVHDSLNANCDVRLDEIGIKRNNLDLSYWCPKKVSEQDIAIFVNQGVTFNQKTLLQSFENSEYCNSGILSGYEQDLVASFIAETAEVYSVPKLHCLLQHQYTVICEKLDSLGVGQEQVLYVVPNSEKSYGMVAALYQRANPTYKGEFISLEEFQSMDLKDLTEKAVVVLDDLCASGSSFDKVRGVLRQRFKGPLILSPSIASTESFEGGVLKNFPGFFERIQKDPYLFIEPAKITIPFHKTEFFQGLPEKDQHALKTILGDLGYGEQGMLIFFPYMTPNNNVIALSLILGPHFTFNGKGISID
jgi:hypothetical protein